MLFWNYWLLLVGRYPGAGTANLRLLNWLFYLPALAVALFKYVYVYNVPATAGFLIITYLTLMLYPLICVVLTALITRSVPGRSPFTLVYQTYYVWSVVLDLLLSALHMSSVPIQNVSWLSHAEIPITVWMARRSIKYGEKPK
jgi:hypothetical protein